VSGSEAGRDRASGADRRGGAAAIGVIGLGEAGSSIAVDLVSAGAEVRGWDPVASIPDGVRAADDAPDAASGADAVLSTNSAAVALEVAESITPSLRDGQVYADLNTTAPALKRELAEAVRGSGGLFADVALMRPVPGRGLSTPALVSGPGAEAFAAIFAPLGMPVTDLGAQPGDAAARKLVRSIFAKGLAAAIGEALGAARRLGAEDWLYADVERTLADADGALLRRLIEGSSLHAGRRAEEMAAAVEMLEELGIEPRVASASEAWLRSLSAERVAESRDAASK
jgi:3-hydroxyisobutyrate dehydrogenase-like beta-hydroxyacid dehydrogenase